MSLDLDKRQRAMLREMGVRVWQPMAPPPPAAELAAPMPEPDAVPAPGLEPVPAEVSGAIENVANSVHVSLAAATLQGQKTPAQIPRPAPPDAQTQSKPGAAWSLGDARPLYADVAPVKVKGPCWLLLAESPAAALQTESFNPFDGDAGKLLDNMLRAARLHQSGTVMLAPLVRRAAADAAPDVDFSAALSALLDQVQPDVVLVMGRLAAQALLQSNEPFGKLRGQVHTLHGIKVVVTLDAPYLLRTQGDKARAWDDLCLAMRAAG